MAETAAHLTDHIFPRLPVRQWVLSVPKRLRYFLHSDPKALNTALRIFLRVIHTNQHQHCASAAGIDKRASHIGACAFIHRFGSSLNTHVHFHICVIDGVFEAGEDSGDNKDGYARVIFHAASHLDAAAIANVQSEVKRRIVLAFVKRGLLDGIAGEAMIDTQHGGGFSVDASVCIGSGDRVGLERQRSSALPLPQTAAGWQERRPGAHPARTHRQARRLSTTLQDAPASHPEAAPLSPADREIQVETPETARRSPARYLWAALIARIY